VRGELGDVDEHTLCCRHEPGLEPGTRVVNTCAGCDRRFRELYDGVSTVSAWEVLAESATFPFPDYEGAVMAVHDACPTRTEARVHEAVRRLLERMNVHVVEPAATRTRAVCCGDSSFGQLPDDLVEELMRSRAASMPAEDVVVYCVSCVKAMSIGGKSPRYLVDLLFGETTEPGVTEPSDWHAELERFVAQH
jgi:Fe-S oxidoreductase